MSHELTFKASAQRQFMRLPQPVKEEVARRLEALQADPRGPGVEALTGQFKGLFRVRVRSYRAVFAIDDAARRIIVTRVAHRGRAYK